MSLRRTCFPFVFFCIFLACELHQFDPSVLRCVSHLIDHAGCPTCFVVHGLITASVHAGSRNQNKQNKTKRKSLQDQVAQTAKFYFHSSVEPRSWEAARQGTSRCRTLGLWMSSSYCISNGGGGRGRGLACTSSDKSSDLTMGTLHF